MNLMKYSIIVLEMLVGYVKILDYIVAYMVFKLFIYRSNYIATTDHFFAT